MLLQKQVECADVKGFIKSVNNLFDEQKRRSVHRGTHIAHTYIQYIYINKFRPFLWDEVESREAWE